MDTEVYTSKMTSSLTLDLLQNNSVVGEERETEMGVQGGERGEKQDAGTVLEFR